MNEDAAFLGNGLKRYSRFYNVNLLINQIANTINRKTF